MARKKAKRRIPQGKTVKRRSLMSRIVLIANIIVAGLLLISYLSPWISPRVTTLPAFLGLGYPYLASVNLIFIIFWLIVFKPFFLISLLSLVAGFPIAARHFQFNARQPVSELDVKARVMSYNVRMFDFYDWKKDEASLERILTDISDQAPDILCLQEFYNNHTTDDDILGKVRELEKLEYHHAAFDTIKGKHAYGIATFSAFPIVGQGEVIISEQPRNHALFTDILLEDDTVRVYNFHLASYYFARDDYDFVEGLQKKKDTRNWYKRSRQLLSKINKGFRIRAEQAETLRAHMDTSPYPIILCGDFNETPGSYVYRLLSRELTDAFRQSGSGIGKTYAGLLPSYRID
ncbi:MAG TPA: endonuclease/exonuclease/phosphatase family protein, partial [Bacteroidales bacterium]|nr:endonuclease/exonuclease/phosphatase family protein [Bacteroidales bacterium]